MMLKYLSKMKDEESIPRKTREDTNIAAFIGLLFTIPTKNMSTKHIIISSKKW